MRKVRKLFRQTINFMLVLSLLLSVVSVGVYASDTDPVVVSVSLNETRSYITIKFDRELEEATTNTQGRVRMARNGGSLSSLYGSTVTVSGSSVHITLSSALNTDENYIQFLSGTFKGQTNVIETPRFAATDPKLISKDNVVLNASDRTVTLKFDSEISGYPNDQSLKNGYIQLARNGSSFNEIIPEEDVTINGEKGEIVIYLSEWLSGTYSRFRICAGKLQNAETGTINLSDITTGYIDASKTVTPPEIDRTDISADKTTVTIYFTELVKSAYYAGVNSSVANSLLKSHIWISRGSTNDFETLGGTDTLTVGQNFIRIVFSEPLSSSRNYIKIDAGSLTDYYGAAISDEILTGNINAASSTSTLTPAYASAFLSSSNRVVIYFTTPVQKNPNITTSQFRSSISVSRNGGYYESITSSDYVSFSDNAMTLSLSEPLYGTSNKIRIASNAIASTSGTVLTSTIITSNLEAGMSSDDRNDSYYGDEDYPEYTDITYDSSAQRVRIYFKNDIRVVSGSNLLNNIYISRNGGTYNSLSAGDIATISPSNAITILLTTPLSGTRNSFRINKGVLADYDSGYVLNSTVTTDYISASGSDNSSSSGSGTTSSDYSGDVSTSLSDDFYTVTLKFSESVFNNQNSLEDLKNKIQISRAGRFETLGADDYVRLDSSSNELLVVLAEPADEYYSQIKILSGALRDADGRTISKNITTLPLGESDGSVRTYINNTAVKGFATSETSASSVTASISGVTKFNTYTRAIELLVKAPSGYDSATLNITGDVVDVIKQYGGTVALSLGNSTYYLPASNVSSISNGDTLSITVNKSTSAVSQKLASASTSDSFSIEAPAKSLKAKIISASGSSKEISHSAFSGKRFMLENPSSNKTAFTVVRIEESGNVVHVPSISEIEGGVVYLTAKTLKDGDYAAVSSSRTLSTVTWAQTPTNMLASRLILTNASGSNINGNEAVTRSETVTIMSKTLGIYGDMSGASPFFDMISTDSYFNAVMSTVSYKLISGYPDSTFKPSNKLTRAEAMTIVARAMRFMKGKSVSASPDMTLEQASAVISKFTDAGTVDNWARIDIAECVQAGVVNGDNKGRLNPKANVTRAELIQLMYNVLKSADIL
ncbi:MAG: S-layer homology domain-containing protein [Oscillospiraceae bacterium]|nr:S-layer homology domain-containing protein [Oscillospiraceae bacterium]